MIFSTIGDGRIDSAVKEGAYIDALKTGMAVGYPHMKFEKGVGRYWWDLRIGGLAINLKLTGNNSSDNSFNKKSVIYSVTGKEVTENMNFNQFWAHLEGAEWKKARDPMSEYHYLVVNKMTGRVLLKSIFDIRAYVTNPSNILQINWTVEFAHVEYESNDVSAKISELLRAIQTSVRQNYENSKKFIDAEV